MSGLDPTQVPLTLYIHLPWCVRKCPYCDFNSHEANGALPEAAYVEALLRDLDEELAPGESRPLQAIFIGGGTPSLFSGAAITQLLNGVRARIALVPDAEITLEANPGAVDEAHFAQYRRAGVNRLSIGVQSLRAAQLQALGRIHTPGDVTRAVAAARAAGFENFNLDLMHGLPGDVAGDALNDLAAALEFGPTHLSWYQLTLEEGTAFARRPPVLPDEDLTAVDFEAGCALLAAAGFQRYEVSAWSLPGRESRHNLNYWTFGDYLAIGAGAHGKLTRAGHIERSLKRRHPQAYMKAPLDERRPVPASELVMEFVINAFRLQGGFEREIFSQRTGLPWAALAPQLEEACARGWLWERAGKLGPTPTGFAFLNDLQLLFMPTDDDPSLRNGN